MITPVENIKFGKFDSIDFGLFLLERTADTPAESEQIEEIPYRQGQADFSFLTGERVYKQRTISYTFLLPHDEYSKRKLIENDIKSMVMPLYNEKLFDSHDQGFYWKGKCASIKVKDDAQTNSMQITFEFSVYPFAIKDNTDKSVDYWDGFDFDNDVLQPTSFDVRGYLKLSLYNNGNNSISPTIITDVPFTIKSNGFTYTFDKGKTEDYYFKIPVGETEIEVYGTGTIQIVIRSEVLI